jgi:D-alanyl-lipoteichoic acid acyltransferase DltB (MBOAT superfamily)
MVGSYIFYGFVHPWFCLLLASSTIVDYVSALGMEQYPSRRKLFLIFSLVWNLGMLGVFKYFNFFAENVNQLMSNFGLDLDPIVLSIMLPVGISFYTFQTLSYTIDVYKGKTHARKNFIDVAVFVAFFPQLVAGPIERATRLLPQFEIPRRWDWSKFYKAWPLLISGYLKKMVIADNIAVYSDQIFSLQHPSIFLLIAGTIAFAIQILADFSAYTDIARGTAKLLGIDLVINFKGPYLAISPSDFWRRWHISFSTWIRDYLYIPLGGSRVNGRLKFLLVLLATLGLSGLWHGAAWNFILWGIYHAVLVFVYHSLGKGGKWKPRNIPTTLIAWVCMTLFTLFGWLIFRTPDIVWLKDVLINPVWGFSGDSLIVGLTVISLVALYSMPLLIWFVLEKYLPRLHFVHAVYYGLALVAIILYAHDKHLAFIYFQF